MKADFYTGWQQKVIDNRTINGLQEALCLILICLTRSYIYSKGGAHAFVFLTNVALGRNNGFDGSLQG